MEWEPLVELPENQHFDVMVAVGSDRIAVVGGQDFDDTRQWSEEEEVYTMREPRCSCTTAVAIEEKLICPPVRCWI